MRRYGTLGGLSIDPDLFGLETCNRERDAIVVLACA
jgi:hypothetical protein